MNVIDLVLALAAVPVALAALYLAVLAVVARRPTPSSVAAGHLRFDIVVPAHDEQDGIAATVASLLGADYPRECFRVLVVADNCTDATATRAAAAGARVLIRHDVEQRGKGYALAYAFRQSASDGFADAVVVVDADTVISRNLLSAFAARFAAGAQAVQADYGVQNVESSWRTRMMTIALAAFHGVRSAARERLGLSCGLRGNGMAFRADLLQAHPPQAFSIVEDVEYGIQLAYAGIRIVYADDAHVWGQMVSSERASRSQRRRWEGGRQALIREHVTRLLVQAFRRGDLVLADLAMDLLVPPLGQLVAVTAFGVALSLAAAMWGGAVVAPWTWGLSLLGIAGYVLRGVAFSGMGLKGLRDLCWAPVYIIWKLTLRLGDRGRKPEEWVRTTREA